MKRKDDETFPHRLARLKREVAQEKKLCPTCDRPIDPGKDCPDCTISDEKTVKLLWEYY
jgi:predicted amidophosphoribosyltransferase